MGFKAPRYTDCQATLQADDTAKPDCICKDSLELYVSASLGPACRDVDECATGVNNRCGAFSSCLNQNPVEDGVGYLCNCASGYGCTETEDRNCTYGGGHMDLDAGCANINECETDTFECRANSNCEDTEGSYVCPCADGFREDGDDCVDILECSNGSAGCEMQCQELPGSFECFCDTGFVVNANNTKTCDQVDECLDDNACGDPNAICTDTVGSFDCTCKPNWEVDEDATDFACKDIDECADGTHTCGGHSVCSNVEEGFECPCAAGYERTGGLATDGSDGSTSACTDINECADTENNPCGENSTCDNIGGSYNCGCQEGYEDRDGTCSDILNCDDPNLNDCHSLATCIELPGSFECECNDNYWGDGREDGHCSSLRECDIGVDVCGPDTECIEADEGFMCRCTTDGYHADPDQAWPTAAENELICTLSTCGPGEGACTVDKATGDITCSATRNYIQLPQCIDINECNDGTDRCGSLGHCNNLDQAYECNCIEGAEPANTDANGNVIECQNVNECDIPCSARVNANCNDCIENVAACDDRIPDKNSAASTNYVCNCIDGYTTSFTFDWSTFTFISACVDEDECLGTAHNCGFNAECNNRNMQEDNMKFECTCNVGYQHETGTDSRFYNCIDIPECSDPELNSCDPVTQQCVEEEPGYTCECAWGYHAEAVVGSRTLVCTDDNECGMPEGELDQDGTARMKCDVFADVPTSECANNDGSYSCTCLTGYDQATMNTTNAQTCLNLDECGTADDYCAETFECQNCTCTDSDVFTTGITHDCGCAPGFTKTLWADIEGSTPSDFQYYCKDDNECLTASTNNCDVDHGVCTNIDGGYTCACATGYQTVGDADEGTQCENVDECTTENAELQHNCHEQATCTDNDGSFSCACNKGWTGDGVNCIDFLECEDQRAAGYSFNAQGDSWFGNALGRINSFVGLGQDFIPCDDRAYCTEREGSYLCECLEGLTGDGYTCDDVDECLDAANNTCAEPVNIDEDAEGPRSVETSLCTNIDVTGDFDKTWTRGYSCGCLDGFEGNGDNCFDIDECLVDGDNTCHAQATCNNFFGRSKYELGYTCTCPDYLVGDGHTCENIDECAPGLNDCGNNTICTDNDNEISGQTDFTCSCMAGYEHDDTIENSFSCKNIDECATGADNCADEGSECTDTDGSWECACIDGYHGNGVNCTDYDECDGENNGHYCGANTACNNLPGTFECLCLDGFTDLENIVVNGTAAQVCSDFINCVDGENDCDTVNAVCNEVVGLGDDGYGYTCSCNAGWTVTADFGRTCEDENECENGNNDCDLDNGICTNSVGSFVCSCNDGYSMDDNGICQDLNECDLSTDNCDDLNGICDNKPGSWACSCAIGWQSQNGTAEGTVCEDINECDGSNMCHAEASCSNNDGSYICECNTGFEDLDTTAANETSTYFTGSNCVNIDECTRETDECDVNAVCADTSGSYTCTCSDAWRNTDDAGRTCLDFDECSSPSENECDLNASCTNNDGSYTCECNDGYETAVNATEGTNCIDIDECARETDNCSDFASCENRVPGFQCFCNAGYRVTDDNGVTCTNEDECQNIFADNECHTELATCNDTEGTYTCTCATGYQGNGFGTEGCQDIDECNTGDHTCDVNAACTNSIGSFTCECNTGWVSSANSTEPGFECVDIDECFEEIDNCDIHATCTDTDGSYTCECNAGYVNVVNGTAHVNDCINQNECFDDIDECDSVNSVCRDTVGSYECDCNAGWTNTTTAGMGEGSCGNYDECMNNDDNLCDTDEGRGGVCIDNDGAYTCACDNLAWSILGADGYNCTNYDECSNPEHNDCDKEHATCDDAPGSYTCTCHIGWTNTTDDGATCNDVDECDNGTHTCDVNSTCMNTLGSYECHCNDGWQSDSVEADAVCTDINECDAGTHSCDINAECSNNDGSYYCLCNIGYYSATNSSAAVCGDVNECQSASADGLTPIESCADNTTCENTVGSYICYCDLGWESDNDGQTETVCVDIDECNAEASLQHACDPNATCNNNDGSYNCDCNPGWYSESNAFNATCEDVDECEGASADGVTEKESCDENSNCRNTIGTYECDCKPGWYSGSSHADMVCENHNECSGASPDNVTAIHDCDENATCEDNDGSYFCNCNLGWYSATNGADTVCENVDECTDASPDNSTAIHSCDVNSECSDTDGSYTCHCISGWKSDSIEADAVCVNVDECNESTENTEMESCAVNSECSDTDGSYDCICNDGWQNVANNTGSDATCEDIDECEGDFTCNDLAHCMNTEGTYFCVCGDGYADVSIDAPGECRNIDECNELNDDGSAMFECTEYSACDDNDGDYDCVCEDGFEQTETGHPAACRDYDECAGENGGNDCGENADCINTPGGFECACSFGYQDTDADTELPGRECELIVSLNTSFHY